MLRRYQQPHLFRYPDAPEGGTGGGIQPGDGSTPPTLEPGATPPAKEGEEAASGEEGDKGSEEPEPAPELTEEQKAALAQENEQFLTSLNELWGQEIVKVDYPDGVDPLSPQGVFLRERAVFEAGQNALDQTLAERYPRGYRYLLHLQNGGTDEEFFSTKTVTLPDQEVFKSDINLQKQLLTSEYRDKGLPTAVVNAAIAELEKDGKLGAEALKVYNDRSSREATALAEMQKKRAEEEQLLAQNVEKLTNGLVTTLKNDLKLVIPETKQGEFLKVFQDALRTDDENNFVLSLPVKQENLKVLMQAMYLIHTGGDLKAAIDKAAAIQVSGRLRNNVINNQARAGAGSASGGSGSKKLTEVWR